MHGEEASNAMERDRSPARETLPRDYGLTSAFVRVPDFARVLGLAECTIYAAMRKHRRGIAPRANSAGGLPQSTAMLTHLWLK